MSQDNEALAELRESLDRRAQVYERVASTGSSVVGTDTTGQLSVHLGQDGSLQRVALTSTWRNSLGPAALGSAVLGAFAAAATERLQGWARQVADDDSTPATRPAPPTHAGLAAELGDLVRAGSDRVDARHAMRSLAEMLREVNAQLDTALDQVQERASREHAGRSSAGRVHAWVNGAGSPVRVEVDETWAARSHGANVAREMTEALRAAISAAAAAQPASVLDGTVLGTIAGDVGDARDIAARLGLL